MAEEYRTRAGTAFYGRSSELARLDSLARTRRLTVVYGPRGAGKGELVRAWAARAGWPDALAVVDAHEARVEGSGPVASALEAALRSGSPSPLDLLEEAMAAAGPGRRVVVAVDGAELLDRYRGLPAESALSLLASDLQAAATAMSRGGRWRGASLVVTTHSGFAGSLYVRGRLACTTSGYIMLLGLDEESFKAFYREYSSSTGCALDALAAYRLSGGLPGLAIEACARADELGEMVRDWLAVLESALAAAKLDFARTLGWDLKPGEIIALAAGLDGLRARPLEAPHHYLLAETLAGHGLAFTKPAAGGVEVRLANPIIAEALKEAAREGLGSTLDLDPDRLLGRLLSG